MSEEEYEIKFDEFMMSSNRVTIVHSDKLGYSYLENSKGETFKLSKDED